MEKIRKEVKEKMDSVKDASTNAEDDKPVRAFGPFDWEDTYVIELSIGQLWFEKDAQDAKEALESIKDVISVDVDWFGGNNGEVARVVCKADPKDKEQMISRAYQQAYLINALDRFGFQWVKEVSEIGPNATTGGIPEPDRKPMYKDIKSYKLEVSIPDLMSRENATSVEQAIYQNGKPLNYVSQCVMLDKKMARVIVTLEPPREAFEEPDVVTRLMELGVQGPFPPSMLAVRDRKKIPPKAPTISEISDLLCQTIEAAGFPATITSVAGPDWFHGHPTVFRSVTLQKR